MNDLRSAIKEHQDKTGETLTSLCQRADVNLPTVSKYMTNPNRDIRHQTFLKLENALKLRKRAA